VGLKETAPNGLMAQPNGCAAVRGGNTSAFRVAAFRGRYLFEVFCIKDKPPTIKIEPIMPIAMFTSFICQPYLIKNTINQAKKITPTIAII